MGAKGSGLCRKLSILWGSGEQGDRRSRKHGKEWSGEGCGREGR